MESVSEFKGRRLVDFLNVDELIQTVEENRTLWDPHDVGYSNKHQRDEAWIRVTVKMVKDFYERPVAEQNEINVGVQKKWRCLRTCYNREVLKQHEERKSGVTKRWKRKEYSYYDKLRFLDGISKRASSSAGEGNNEDNCLFSDVITLISKTEPSAIQMEKVESKNKRSRIGEPTIEFEHTNIKKEPQDSTDGDDSMTNEESSPSVQIQTHTPSLQEDEDKLFLLSILPDMRKIPQENKLKVKSDILLVMSNGQSSGSYNSPFFPLP